MSTVVQPDQNGHVELAGPADYLLDRGFPPETILEVGWRVERLGPRCRRYGLPEEAASVWGWLIPYRHRNGHTRFERLRLIHAADLERFGGGKYRQPAGVRLGLYDPYGALERDILEELLLIEGEANTVAVHVALPELPAVGLPGQSVLANEMAEQIGHVPLVHVWIDRHDPGAAGNAERITRRLREAGVGEVRFLPPAAGLDANDALRELGPQRTRETLRAMIDQAREIEERDEESWPPIPRATLPAFPLAALPPAVAEFVRATSDSTETPIDMAAIAALGVLSVAAIGWQVDCGTHEEELPLYLLVVMESGDRKSSVLNAVAQPLRQIEREARDEARPKVQELELRRQTLDARKAKLIKKAADADDVAQRAPLEEELEEIAQKLGEIGEPLLPRFLADDATPETLGSLLVKYGPQAVVSAEAPIISNLLGRYDSAGAANLDLVCKAYEGEHTRVDRRNREELLPRPLVTIVLTVQPHILSKLVENETARRQGLVARFAFSMPESRLGHRRHDGAAVPQALRRSWEDLVRHVYARKPLTELTEPISVSSVSTKEIENFKLSLSPPARELLRGLSTSHEPRLREGADLRPVSDWFSRHPGRIARIAAILHLCGDHGTVISSDTMARALQIGEYLLDHAIAALTTPDSLTRRAVVWLEERNESRVTVRDIHRGPLNSRGRAERAHELADRLVALGYLRQAPASESRRPGQPPSPAFDVHPVLRGARR